MNIVMCMERQKREETREALVEDGGSKMEDRRWRMVDGGWWMVDGGWWMVDGGWGMGDEGWRMEGGVSRAKGEGQRVLFPTGFGLKGCFSEGVRTEILRAFPNRKGFTSENSLPKGFDSEEDENLLTLKSEILGQI
jgi:hypothetical protein